MKYSIKEVELLFAIGNELLIGTLQQFGVNRKDAEEHYEQIIDQIVCQEMEVRS